MTDMLTKLTMKNDHSINEEVLPRDYRRKKHYSNGEAQETEIVRRKRGNITIK